MAKVRQKIFGRFRSPEYADAYCRISSYLKSMGPIGYNPLTTIRIALKGNAAESVGDASIPARWTWDRTNNSPPFQREVQHFR